jgi:hypothetical protein
MAVGSIASSGVEKSMMGSRACFIPLGGIVDGCGTGRNKIGGGGDAGKFKQ